MGRSGIASLTSFVSKLDEGASNHGEWSIEPVGEIVVMDDPAGISERSAAEMVNQFGEPLSWCVVDGGWPGKNEGNHVGSPSRW